MQHGATRTPGMPMNLTTAAFITGHIVLGWYKVHLDQWPIEFSPFLVTLRAAAVTARRWRSRERGILDSL